MSETSLDPHPTLIPLRERGLIAITGEDAARFLSALLTANIETLPAGKITLAALLTPQGKIIADMLVANASDDEPLFFLDLNKGFVEDIAARLARYKLRSEVVISVLSDEVAVFALLDAPPLANEGFYSFDDARHPRLGQRLYGPADAIEATTAGVQAGDAASFGARRVALGIPECGPDYLPLDRYPHEANLDQLGGVDFRKGCYIGQEIVSRMEHRGTARTRTVIARFENGFGVESGAEVRAGNTLLGTLGVSAGAHALAAIRLDKLAEARTQGLQLTGGGVSIVLDTPAYARFAS